MKVTTENLTFELNDNETLLEGLERTGHKVEYQCRSGYCGSCRVKIRSGKVSYEYPPLAFIANDEILPCCCRLDSPINIRVKLIQTKSNDKEELIKNN